MKLKKIIIIFFAIFFIMLNSTCANGDTSGFFKEVNEIVSKAEKIEIAKLKTATAESTRKNRFSKNTIAGYPIIGKVATVNKTKMQDIDGVILNPENYANLLQRCENNVLYGIRFSKGTDVAEFAYSQPCMQAQWVVKIKGNIMTYGGVLGPAFSKVILALFNTSDNK